MSGDAHATGAAQVARGREFLRAWKPSDACGNPEVAIRNKLRMLPKPLRLWGFLLPPNLPFQTICAVACWWDSPVMNEIDPLSGPAALVTGALLLLSLSCLVGYVIYFNRVKQFARFLQPRLEPAAWQWTDMLVILITFFTAAVFSSSAKTSLEADPSLTPGMALIYSGLVFQLTLLSGLFFLLYLGRKLHGAPCPFTQELAPHAQSHARAPLHKGRLIFICVTVQLALWPFVAIAAQLNTFIMQLMGRKPELQAIVKILMETDSRLVMGSLLFMAVILAPVIEELLFRCFLYRFLKKHMHWQAAMLASAVAFACIHDAPLFNLLPLTLLGCAFTLVYEYKRTLWAPVIMHAVFNLTQCLMMLALKTTV